ncbi:spore germination protein [Cytobacillus praedii]|uniref:Spore germination protein n=1 Tax=Cytobacillus praedii TaxID=1742358 RepID=A0A4R1B070_9BACI|nr:spore germination protein [Cytobacillus praedii]MED3551499.1 spore germination protein [Cytobacillus praedii]MED3572440.1 spore germination protein [Cytobacillus praedii]TCJ04470.1 spore germination protein [Cytobacillus praedii]
MPAITGPVQIVNIDSGIVQFGDAVFISPKSSSKSVLGQGAGNTGGFIIANNGLSASNVLDTNLVDQPILGNN